MSDYTCPTCGAEFEREYTHCGACGQHYRGEHECVGPADWEKRKARALAHKRELRWTVIGRDEKGENILLAIDHATYDYD